MIPSIIGGILIGLAAGLLWIFFGRIFGVSGIFYRALRGEKPERPWRFAILAGLVATGFLFRVLGERAVIAHEQSPFVWLLAGLFIGVGTRVGHGCTSGHGVCGIGRFSLRSLVATVTFTGVAIVTVYVLRHMLSLI